MDMFLQYLYLYKIMSLMS